MLVPLVFLLNLISLPGFYELENMKFKLFSSCCNNMGNTGYSALMLNNHRHTAYIW